MAGTMWLFYAGEAAQIVGEFLEAVDWAEVRSAIAKIRVLENLSEKAAQEAAAEEIAADLDDAIDWEEHIPGFIGLLLENQDFEAWKRICLRRIKRQVRRQTRGGKRGVNKLTRRIRKRAKMQ